MPGAECSNIRVRNSGPVFSVAAWQGAYSSLFQAAISAAEEFTITRSLGMTNTLVLCLCKFPSTNSRAVVSFLFLNSTSAAMATTEPHPPGPTPPVTNVPTKKPSSLAILWQKLGLDAVTLILMAK